ncbi:cyclic nucleotide-binding domain-containing protein [Microvirga thermotolerans]|uniref:Cyclic nucleotide-binding domain-containing protein n=1 Tax=Microvirga thermotolerans TaxID=2651334 RepID=A0A5P9JTN1_9HYPH|nr:cyclic nucleotide-binding domain-containing protein [Microvirga thermotolerans]QFU14986.1 cyclic nucleotide-binding domain-containing protein [Microvirga thermotolerans]
MALDDDIAVLSGAPLFSLLDRDALRLVAFAAETRNLREGDTLFRKGDRSDGGYVVSRGAIALDAREDGSAAEFVAGPGALIGQAALFARIERPATAIAREPSTVIRVAPSLMRRVLEEFPAAAAAMHEALALDLVRLTEGLERVRRRLVAIDGEESPAARDEG